MAQTAADRCTYIDMFLTLHSNTVDTLMPCTTQLKSNPCLTVGPQSNPKVQTPGVKQPTYGSIPHERIIIKYNTMTAGAQNTFLPSAPSLPVELEGKVPYSLPCLRRACMATAAVTATHNVNALMLHSTHGVKNQPLKETGCSSTTVTC